MGHQEFEALRARLQKLEQRLHFVVIGWLLSIAIVWPLSIWAEQAISQQATMRVKNIQVVDVGGRKRIELGVDNDSVGGSNLKLYDEAGKLQVYLSSAKFGPELLFYDQAEKTRLGFHVLDLGPDITLYDTSGAERLSLHVSPVLGPSFDLFDSSTARLVGTVPKTGEVRASLTVIAGVPSLKLSDAEGFKTTLGGTQLKNTVTGVTTKRAAASLVFFGKDKKVIWSAP